MILRDLVTSEARYDGRFGAAARAVSTESSLITRESTDLAIIRNRVEDRILVVRRKARRHGTALGLAPDRNRCQVIVASEDRLARARKLIRISDQVDIGAAHNNNPAHESIQPFFVTQATWPVLMATRHQKG